MFSGLAPEADISETHRHFGLVPILLQKSGIGGREFSRRNTIQPTISDLYSLNRVSEVADEFVVRR
jgi:hypothetical protein